MECDNELSGQDCEIDFLIDSLLQIITRRNNKNTMDCSFVESVKKQFCNDDNNIADQFTSILDDYHNKKKNVNDVMIEV